MREVIVSLECEKFLEESSKRVQLKFDYLLAVISEQDVVSKNFVDKLVGTDFYELRIKAENQIRVIIFTIDSQNFQTAERIILLNAFVKKSTKDYKAAIKNAQKLLNKYKYDI